MKIHNQEWWYDIQGMFSLQWYKRWKFLKTFTALKQSGMWSWHTLRMMIRWCPVHVDAHYDEDECLMQ